LALLLAAWPSSGALVAAESRPSAVLQGVSYDQHAVRIRVDREVPYRVFSLAQPPRLVVELAGTMHRAQPHETSVNDGVVRRIRSAQFKTSPERVTRVVVEVPRVPTYEARWDGKDVVLQLGDATSAAAPASSAPTAELAASEATGQDVAVVEASAAERSSSGSGAGKPRDLLSSLPKNRITIDFDEADIRDVLRVLSEMSGLNIIYTADLRGTVTIHLDQVPFEEVFSTILSMQGLVAQQMGNNILRILSPEALNADRARSVVAYRTFILNYAKASDIQAHLTAVKISPNAKVSVMDSNNMLVVTDTPEGLAAAERLIAELDVKPHQVLIEAKLVEISDSDQLQLGVQWEYSNFNLVNPPSGDKQNMLGFRNYTEGTTVPEGELGFGQNIAGEDFVVNSKGPGARGTGVSLPGPKEAGISFGFINNTDLLTATLNALTTQNKAKNLSDPKIVTINNKEAKIQSVQRIPYSTVTQNGTSTTQSITYIDAGVILTVTPTINADDRIRLRVKPEVSIPKSTAGIAPTVDTRNAETEVVIRDGETLVIGGLITDLVSKDVSKVPLLGDLPLIGTFFRSTTDKKNRLELLVFITPRIIRD
jgi:type IV pilus assembly protein PilQ